MAEIEKSTTSTVISDARPASESASTTVKTSGGSAGVGFSELKSSGAPAERLDTPVEVESSRVISGAAPPLPHEAHGEMPRYDIDHVADKEFIAANDPYVAKHSDEQLAAARDAARSFAIAAPPESARHLAIDKKNAVKVKFKGTHSYGNKMYREGEEAEVDERDMDRLKELDIIERA